MTFHDKLNEELINLINSKLKMIPTTCSKSNESFK